MTEGARAAGRRSVGAPAAGTRVAPTSAAGARVAPAGAVADAPATADPAVGAVFAALADPTRRRVVRELAQHSTVTASALAAELPITRQAIAKHLAALADAGLVTGAREGRETRYRLTPAPLADAVRWIEATGARWDERLERLDRQLASAAGAGEAREMRGQGTSE